MWVQQKTGFLSKFLDVTDVGYDEQWRDVRLVQMIVTVYNSRQRSPPHTATLMKTLLVTSSLSLVMSLTCVPCLAQDKSPLSVINFGWSRYVTALDAEPEWRNPVRTRQQQIDDRERQTVERGYGDLMRGRDLRKFEREARRSSVKDGDLFTYRVKVHNTDTKTVMNIYWEYVVLESQDRQNQASRQFFCAAKIKANGRASLHAISASMPRTKAISAKALADPKHAFEENIVINRIEYADGSLWQREGWVFPSPAAAEMSKRKRLRGGPACTTF